ncbi:hypothetical protein [Actinoplanes flavus]|uniref:DUF4034 domain-containing protein n=1 Tax=Actinoplanes flavus TaxID=2820290 RepID=A0ABS3UM53_9ACTN|nr:hypothetical protein [Actinoplanes flavus]MBO3739864.1 hypothetical protein [Actinoplanes flavus]
MWSFKKRREAAPAAPEFCSLLGDPDAERLTEALLKRDWGTARGILATPDPEHRSYYLSLTGGMPGLEEWITGPVRDEPDSTLPLLVRGARYISWAWEARGTGWGDTVSEEAAKLWFDRLRRAEDCLDEVVEREPGNADAWRYLITLGRARDLPQEERRRRFDGLIAADPTHYFGHVQMLEGLMPKWGGSTEAMFTFARERAAACPGTHIPTLVVLAHLENRRGNGGNDYLERDDVAEDIWQASQLSVFHDDYQETLLTPIVWNNFAFALTFTGQFPSACSIYDVIEDDWIMKSPWGDMDFFVECRDYARSSLEDDD